MNPFADEPQESGHNLNPFQSIAPNIGISRPPVPIWSPQAPTHQQPQPQPQRSQFGGYAYGNQQHSMQQSPSPSVRNYGVQPPNTQFPSGPFQSPTRATQPTISTEQFDNLKAQNHQLNEDYRRLEAKNRTLETKIASLQSEIEKLTPSESERQNDLDSKDDAIKKQQNEIADLKKRNSRLESRLG